MKKLMLLAVMVIGAGAAAAQDETPDIAVKRQMTTAERNQAFSACIRLGVPPGTADMLECVEAPTGTIRLQVADRVKGGTR